MFIGIGIGIGKGGLVGGDWTPLALSGLQTWHHANDESLLTLREVTGTFFVEEIANAASADIDAAQSTDGNQPTRVASGDNFVTRYATDNFLDLGVEEVGTTGLFATSTEAFYVAAIVNIANNNQGTVIARSAAADRTFQIYFDRPTVAAATPAIGIRGGFTNTGWGYDDGADHLIEAFWDGSVFLLVGDGGADSLLIIPGTANENTGQRIIYGARTNGAGFFMNGDLGDILIADEAPSDADRYRMQGFLAHKWGIADNLPAGHPFASTAPLTGSDAFEGMIAAPDIDSGGQITVDAATDTLLFTSNPDAKGMMASLTKIATAIICEREIVDWDATTTITAADIADGGSDADLQENDVVSLEDLLYGMLLPSGNDAANALARVVGQQFLDDETGGTGNPETRFIEEMNDLATELGMTNTLFTQVHGGSDDDTHASTPRDLYLLMKEALTLSHIVTVGGTKSHTMTITGANARTYDVTHTFPAIQNDDEDIVFAKTGTGFDGQEHRVVVWESATGEQLITVVYWNNDETEDTDFETIRTYVGNHFSWSGGQPVLS